MIARILVGDCRVRMAEMEENSIDAIVCDPPYALTDVARTMQHKAGSIDSRSGRERSNSRRAAGGFMGKVWDAELPGIDVWTAALRVAKPGAHLLAFGGTRTFHRLTCAIEDAGWEIRDCLSWLYGSGFPKSLDVSKAIDRTAGVWRGRAGPVVSENGSMSAPNYERTDKGEPITPAAAAAWSGWGTALKPAWEPIVLARKPLTGTVAANVQRFGTGAINVDACRIGTSDKWSASGKQSAPSTTLQGGVDGSLNVSVSDTHPLGRWPANVCLDETAAAMLDEQSGELTSGDKHSHAQATRQYYGGGRWPAERTVETVGDSGGASRFFYTSKASAADRNDGLEGMPEVKSADDGYGSIQQPKLDRSTPRENWKPHRSANHHPTVKPFDLMRWLVRLVTPPGGTVLDPFAGSGSTGVAALAESFNFIGIELSPEYAAIAERRIANVAPLLAQVEAETPKPSEDEQLSLDITGAP